MTLKQIARELGVSVQTVSYAMSGGGTLSSDTREKVRAGAEALGYRPNGMARAMRSGKFGHVALLLSTESWRSSLPTSLLDGIHDALAERDLHLTLAKVPDDQLRDQAFVPKILREWMRDGLLINYFIDAPPALHEMIARHRVPAVWLNAKRKWDCAFPDDFAGAQLATRFLLELGHTRVLYDGNPHSHHYSVQEREDGFISAMREAGYTPQLSQPRFDRHMTPREWDDFFARWKTRDPRSRPTAFLTYGSQSAQVARLMAERNGVRVPDDVSVIGFCEERIEAGGLPITTALIPGREEGCAGVELLMQKIDAPHEPLLPRALPFSILPGDSTGPVR